MLHDAVTRLPSQLWTPQRDAADCVLNAFAMGAERQLVVMPCGTGKTHLAVHIAHEIAPNSRSLVVVPTLDLLHQTARVWYDAGRKGTYLGLCSDKETSEAALAGVLTLTRDPADLTARLRAADGPTSVFVTYQSLHKLPPAHQEHLLPRWDLIVVDEAHRTAGARNKRWGIVHDNDAIPARHRLYLTATPRIWDVNKGITAEPVASMDDVTLYGKVAYRYSLAQAIHEGRLADYRIAAPEIHDPQLRAALALNGRRCLRTPQGDAMRVAAGQLALFEARARHGIRRTVVFSRSIVQCDAFAETLPETAAILPGRHADGLWTAAIHSGHSRALRKERTDRFASPGLPPARGTLGDLNVLCNVRLCVEGVDFPLADSVLFTDPKRSTIDIVQAIGRALRIAPGTDKIATLIIPVVFGPGQRPEEATFGTPYHLLHQVMIALRAYDEHVFVRLPVSGPASRLSHNDIAIRPARAREIAPHLMLRIMEPEPDVWDTGMAAAQQYFDDQGHLNVPSNYIDAAGFHLGCWLGYQRALKLAGNLTPARTAALATCKMTWSHPKGSTEHYLHLAQAYASEHGHLLAEPAHKFRGRPLGQWLAEQRQAAADGTLPPPYERALKDIDPYWNPSWPREWQRMCTRARAGRLTIPAGPLPTHADDLTRWLDEQFDAFPTLTKGQQSQLAALALRHDPLALALRRPHGHQARTHAQGLRAARRFFRRHQHLRVPADYADDHGGTRFPLGRWIADLRIMVGEGLLNHEEIDSVEALAMEWLPGLACDNAPAALPATPTTATLPADTAKPTPPPDLAQPSRHHPAFWIADRQSAPSALSEVLLHGGRRQLLSLPAGAGKTMIAATLASKTASPVCLVLGPDPTYLHHVVKTWRLVRPGPLAALNMRPTRNGNAGTTLASAGDLADWMTQQPPGSLVLARYRDAGLIAESHRDHDLPPWDHLIVEEAHRTAEGIIDPHHPHATIHYDDGILAHSRLYLTATPCIPYQLPVHADQMWDAWAVNMPNQPIFGIHQHTAERPELEADEVLSPYQWMQIHVPQPPPLPGPRWSNSPMRWRAQAIGAAHLIELNNLRRVVAVLKDLKQAEAFACQLAVQMLDAEIVVPPQGATRQQHNQPVIRCQRASDPMPPDLDAVVLPADHYTTIELVDALRPLMGQRPQRATQTAIIVPEAVAPNAPAPTEPTAVMRKVTAAIWAHDPTTFDQSAATRAAGERTLSRGNR
ncbi:DEAD/DEAH box helicase [Streptomyces griseoviridis]|uniref:DEAD/DEAH box helicase n=1 Tax=Streptomyces griseoviridis TaxID=45398 RepID=A0A3S9ZNY1_STRGD|nr:Helicase associated domain protein [Streptomyces griseoviridis]AZS89586.1 DEAD/DEAH box helicase [Streptomyces griseoviridis]QCN83576.1 hypothetical protein DDJ31_00155 [Streptomyces griseoviridis]